MRKAVNKAAKLARDVARWQKKLAPRLPDIDPHNLRVILRSLLRRKHGYELRFLLRRRENSGHAF